MGSPLVPVLANLFMGFHEQNWIGQATNVKPIFCKRYMDDIFAVFESESDADVFYSYLITRLENIKFTFNVPGYCWLIYVFCLIVINWP